MYLVSLYNNSRPNGERFEGYWRDGKKEGKGRLFSAEGKVIEGVWKNDKYIENN